MLPSVIPIFDSNNVLVKMSPYSIRNQNITLENNK